ncbi:MAG: S-formylglutathione hydrolase, partial [Alphaproteobacteria bacterium]|nr:S-formylglutathione hydrolase [Alphaproteobacteria bacterium]
MILECLSSVACFGGEQCRYLHAADTTQCNMHFSIYLPPQARSAPVPVVYWLSGLTCTDENFVIKAGAQRYAAELGLALVAPDTSPRGEGVPDDPDKAYDFGLGAGFYVNATQKPWSMHYQMADYIVQELPHVLSGIDALDLARVSVAGHSMGGHGAITLALNNPARYQSISAFAPISSPIHSPWGQKALSHYLGDNQQDWQAHDSAWLIANTQNQLPLLVDQGDADNYLREQLMPEHLLASANQTNYPLNYNLRAGYDHSY